MLLMLMLVCGVGGGAVADVDVVGGVCSWCGRWCCWCWSWC